MDLFKRFLMFVLVSVSVFIIIQGIVFTNYFKIIHDPESNINPENVKQLAKQYNEKIMEEYELMESLNL